MNNESRQKQAIKAVQYERQLRIEQEQKDEIIQLANRGSAILDNQKRLNLMLMFGCRPSAGVKANTDMVKNILIALIDNADRVNCRTLIPWALDFIESSDAQFETSTSSKIQTLQLFYKYDTVTHSIGFVFYDKSQSIGFNNNKDDKYGIKLCSQMLKKALKLDKVHTFG